MTSRSRPFALLTGAVQTGAASQFVAGSATPWFGD